MKEDTRTEHPYWIWESIMETPEYLRAYLKPAFQKKVAALADRILAFDPHQIVICGTGSSYFVALAEAVALDQILGMPVHTHVTTEMSAYPPSALGPHTLCLFNSHSGETIGDPEAVALAKEKGALTVGVTDIPDSTLAQSVDAPFIGEGGSKHELPATRTYAEAYFRVLLLGLEMAKILGKEDLAEEYGEALQKIPDQLETLLTRFEEKAQNYVEELASCSSFFVVGSGANVATAYEGALGLSQSKEVPATAFPTENFLHGPIQTLTEDVCVVVIAALGPLQNRLFQTGKAVKIIGSKVLLLQPEDLPTQPFADFTILCPSDIPDLLTPLVYISPLWQVGYFISLSRGANPDPLSMDKEAFQEAMAYLMKGDEKFGG